MFTFGKTLESAEILNGVIYMFLYRVWRTSPHSPVIAARSRCLGLTVWTKCSFGLLREVNNHLFVEVGWPCFNFSAELCKSKSFEIWRNVLWAKHTKLTKYEKLSAAEESVGAQWQCNICVQKNPREQNLIWTIETLQENGKVHKRKVVAIISSCSLLMVPMRWSYACLHFQLLEVFLHEICHSVFCKAFSHCFDWRTRKNGFVLDRCQLKSTSWPCELRSSTG